MSMPQIPEEKNRPTQCEVTIDLLKSVALEETALAHILNAEGERSQAVVKKYECCCDEITLEELTASVRQTEKIMSTIIMKEWLLLKKMETAFEINQKMNCNPKEEEPDSCRCGCCERCCNHCCNPCCNSCCNSCCNRCRRNNC